MNADELIDPVCGMKVRPDGPHRLEHGGVRFALLQSALPGEVPGRARALSPARAAAAAGAARFARDLHLPDAPRGAQRRPGSCPICGMALEPLAPSLAEAPSEELRDFTRRLAFGAVADRAARRARDAGAATRDPAPAGHAGRPLLRGAVLRARARVAAHRQPQHVHVDRAGHGGRMGVQRGCGAGARRIPRRVSRHARRGRAVLRSGGGDRRAGAAGAGARAARAAAHGRRAALAALARARHRAPGRRGRRGGGRAARGRFGSAIACACGPARRSPWTRACWTARARSTRRSSPASRCRSRSGRATR